MRDTAANVIRKRGQAVQGMMLGAAVAVDAESARRKVLTRCGECRGCQGEDCGQCANCADKPKFGGAGAPYFPVTG